MIKSSRISIIRCSVKPHVIKSDHEYGDMIRYDRENQHHFKFVTEAKQTPSQALSPWSPSLLTKEGKERKPGNEVGSKNE